MIWSVVSKDEMENFGTSNVFKFYQEALGRDNIKLVVVDETDNLGFVSDDDIVLLRTASKSLIDTIRKKGVKTTAEDFDTYYLANDKVQISRFLHSQGISASKAVSINYLENGKTYFVKPRFGSDSKGVSEKSICNSIDEVLESVDMVNSLCGGRIVVEEFVDGREFTVTVVNTSDGIKAFAIEVDCSETFGIQTQKGKAEFAECGLPLNNVLRKEVTAIAKRVFEALGIKHHARIDFRMDKNGEFYVIDVNLIPGLGPTGDLARCMLLTENYSYTDALKMVIASATKL